LQPRKKPVTPTTLQSSQITTEPQRFKILAIDGGGFRGLYAAQILAEIEAQSGRATCEAFDLITGTSTGGILALGLALGIPAAAIRDFYLKSGAKIFPCHWWSSMFRRVPSLLYQPKYGGESLEAALKELYGENTKLGQCKTKVVIPATNLSLRSSYLFKTKHLPEYRSDHERLAWEIGMATSAAPTYFPYFESSWGASFSDGGLWANNPSYVGYLEANALLGISKDEIRLLNIGNLQEYSDGGTPSWALSRGAVFWAPTIAEIFMQVQTSHTEKLMKGILGERFSRVEPALTEKQAPLDRYCPQAILPHADHAVRVHGPLLNEFFK
jgi:uncharacterized protein